MSWTDKKSVEVIKYLRDKYDIKTFIETGAFKGINARLHSKNFDTIMTCENNKTYFNEAFENLRNYNNVVVVRENSPLFLKRLLLNTYIFYLDAHFYNPNLSKKDRFVVLKELENMKKFKDSVIIIHDFDNGLGHITYDNIDLNMDLLRKKLKRINKKFFFYTNTLEGCDIVKSNAKDMRDAGLEVDFDTLDNLDYAWTTPRLAFRGLLYCLPSELNELELKQLGLRKWN